MKVKMIMACDLNNGIGCGNGLPWPRDVEDMRMFKRLTTGHGNNAVIMGYKTWMSLPENRRPLSGRMNFVITSKRIYTYEPNVCFLQTFDDVMRLIEDSNNNYNEFWIIGGKSIYEQATCFMPISEIHLTTFKQTYACDVFCNIRKLLDIYNISYDTKFVYENTTRKIECLQVKQRTVC
jgi:dihydrofolate reductase